MLICIVGSNEKLEKVWNKLVKATPRLKHTKPAPCSNPKMGAITLDDKGELRYYNALSWKKMTFYDKRYMLNNIYHFTCFIRAVKDIHDEAKTKEKVVG